MVEAGSWLVLESAKSSGLFRFVYLFKWGGLKDAVRRSHGSDWSYCANSALCKAPQIVAFLKSIKAIGFTL